MRKHEAIDCITLCRRLTCRFIALRLGLRFRNNTIHGKSQEYDTDCSASVYEALLEVPRLHELQIMGALVNPLYQCRAKMIDAGLCTKEQYEAGKTELIRRMSAYYAKDLDASDGGLLQLDQYDRVDLKWSDANAPKKRAEEEFDTFQKWIVFGAQPKMEPLWVLGAVGPSGQPTNPIYSFGRVTEKGSDYRSGSNLADFIDDQGHFDLIAFFVAHKRELPALNSIVIGQLAPHISTEVDCESLFSEAGFLADKRRSRIGVRYYERLVTLKHRLHRIYCHQPLVVARFLQRWQRDEWREQDEIEVNEFFKIEKELYLQRYPNGGHVFDDVEEEFMPGDGALKCEDAEKKETKNGDDEGDEDSVDLLTSPEGELV